MHDNVRDYFELARFLPPIMIFVFVDRWRSLRPEHLLWATAIFLALDGLVTYLQTTKSDLYGIQQFAQAYYNSDHHVQNSTGSDVRALGIASGPAQHAAIVGACVVIMLNAAFAVPRFAVAGAAGACIATILLVCAQSQTGLVIVSLVICGLLGIQVLKGNAWQRTFSMTVAAILVFSATTLFSLLTQFRYLNSLFELGLSRNSYIVRTEIRQHVLEMMAETPQWYPIGHGKAYFGTQSAAMDNEYLHVLAIYGLPVLLVALSAVPPLVYRLVWQTPRLTTEYWSLTLLGLLALGLGCAWPSSFFTEARSMTIFCLVLAAQQTQHRTAAADAPISRRSPRRYSAPPFRSISQPNALRQSSFSR
jgi:hypothetical protein